MKKYLTTKNLLIAALVAIALYFLLKKKPDVSTEPLPDPDPDDPGSGGGSVKQCGVGWHWDGTKCVKNVGIDEPDPTGGGGSTDTAAMVEWKTDEPVNISATAEVKSDFEDFVKTYKATGMYNADIAFKTPNDEI